MSKVYVPQIPVWRDRETGKFVAKWDLTPAEKYGTLTALLDSRAGPYESAETIDILHEKLADYRDEDCIIAIGSPALLSWTVSIAAYYNTGTVTMLQWNGIKNEYDRIEAQLW